MLTGYMVSNFTQKYVLANLDEPKDSPEFHLELWNECCSDSRYTALICPRGHGKSTAITEIFTLCSIMERKRNYVIIISDTLKQAELFLSGIKTLIEQSPQMQVDYGFAGWIKEQAAEVIGHFDDGAQFCITALGRGQQIRGRLWRNQRPNLILCDDIEDEKSVESDDRREDTREWLGRGVMPALADSGILRATGTILHLDALLYRLNHNDNWNSSLYRAHESFNDFSNLLWTEKWPELRLRKEQKTYVDDGHPDMYATEYLNNPINPEHAYFGEEDFHIMDADDFALPMEFYGAVDLAISDKDKAAYTAICIAGLASNGLLYIRLMLRYRSNDSSVHVNNMIELQRDYNIKMWMVEKGHIEASMRGYLEKESQEQGIFLNMHPDTVPVTDKVLRARSFQGLMKSGRVRWDHTAAWYPDCKVELLQFPKGQYKDQVDSLAWMGKMIAELAPAASEEDRARFKREEDVAVYEAESTYFGMDPETGY